MVIYAQRVRQFQTALGVASARPVQHESGRHGCVLTAPVSGSGMPMCNEASAWSIAAGALRLGNARLAVTALPTTALPTTKATTKPDAFVGIHSGPCTSTSPPV